MSRPSSYQEFIRNRMPTLRREHPNLENKEYMKMAGAEWTRLRSETKINKPEPKFETIKDNAEYQKFVDTHIEKLRLDRPNLREKDYDNLIKRTWLESHQ